MLVFSKQKLVFLATPKAGSTAIETALSGLASVVIMRPPQLKHTPARRFQRFLAPWLAASQGDEFELCALMREPRDWLGSWYRYRQREGVPEARSTRAVSFDQFVRAYCSKNRPEYAEVGSQAQFLAAKGGSPVDHIFRYERMEDFVIFLEDRLDCSIILPRINVSPEGATDLSAETAALLRQTCAADFELYESLIRP